jgi:hypothetical protein
MANNKPIRKFEVGGVSAAVWENEISTSSGDKTVERVTFDRRYKDKDGQWKSTGSFNASDLPRLRLAIEKAYEWLVCDRQKESDDDVNGSE